MGTEKARCVIIESGPAGDLNMLRGLIKPDDYVICADGGTDHLKKLGVRADIVIGDIDSALSIPDGVEIKRFKAEKNETDTLLAVMHGMENGFSSFLIIGGLKGRLDHTVANFSVLQYISRHGADGCFVDSDNEAYFIENGSMTFSRRNDYYISVFPFGGQARGVTEEGFKYGLDRAVLKTDFPNGVSNEFSEPYGKISVESGSLLIILSRK